MRLVSAALGLGQTCGRLSGRAVLGRLNIAATVILATTTVAVTSVLAFSSSQLCFLEGHPALIQQIDWIPDR